MKVISSVSKGDKVTKIEWRHKLMINHLALNTPYFGILLSVIPFFLATVFIEKTNRFFLFAPLFVSMVFGVTLLYLTGIA